MWTAVCLRKHIERVCISGQIAKKCMKALVEAVTRYCTLRASALQALEQWASRATPGRIVCDRPSP